MLTIAAIRPFIPYIAGLVGILGLFVWIDRKADDKFERWVEEFRQEQLEVNRKLQEDFRTTTDEALRRLDEDRKVTQDVLQEFLNQDGATDPSGIDGKFLRD